MSGMVTLVGAGPGDPGLLTRKGLEALEKAEVVVYDRLVAPEILALIPEKAEAIDVGKQASHHLVPQDEINRILLRKAQEGKNVVRLKGGDPFVFGRGGEEIMALQAAGIPYEEVPGISSAIAIPAAAGIPSIASGGTGQGERSSSSLPSARARIASKMVVALPLFCHTCMLYRASWKTVHCYWVEVFPSILWMEAQVNGAGSSRPRWGREPALIRCRKSPAGAFGSRRSQTAARGSPRYSHPRSRFGGGWRGAVPNGGWRYCPGPARPWTGWG